MVKFALNDQIDRKRDARVQAIFCACVALLFLWQAGACVVKYRRCQAYNVSQRRGVYSGFITTVRGLSRRLLRISRQIIGPPTELEIRAKSLAYIGVPLCVARMITLAKLRTPIRARFAIDILPSQQSGLPRHRRWRFVTQPHRRIYVRETFGAPQIARGEIYRPRNSRFASAALPYHSARRR